VTRRDADLHVHTTHSDGACSPCEVVVAAASVGLAAVAITDHDTVSALAVARPEADRLGVELVPGVEMTCEYQGREIHLLGYYFREHPSLLAALERLRSDRAGRFVAMAARLEDLGMVVDLTAVRRCFPRATLGRRHLAEYLHKTKQASSVREVFDRYLADGKPAEVPKARLDAFEAVALVREAGGVVSWAHPPHTLRLESLRTLVEAGLTGIEAAGPGVQNRVGRRFRDWAAQLDLVPTAGSDFHAADRPGRRVGAYLCPQADLNRLRERAPGAVAPPA
jgi:predicted metal-dependent phosphoesterase TrpH